MLIFIFVKIMNVFLFVVMRLSVRSIKKYHSSQSAGNVSIYQNIFKKFFLKIAPPKNSFSKVLPKKIHFRNCSLKNAFSKLIPQKCIFKITSSKNIFQKKKKKTLLPQKIHFQNCFLKKINLISLTHSLSESSDLSEEEKSLKLSFIYLIAFF